MAPFSLHHFCQLSSLIRKSSLAGCAAYVVSFMRYHAPNLTVPMNDIASMWVDSRIAVGHNHLRRISARVTALDTDFTSPLVRRRIARRERVFRGFIDC